YYYRDRRVQQPGLTEKFLDRLRVTNTDLKDPDTYSWRSPYELMGQYRFNRDWSVSSDFNWNPNTRRTASGSAMFHSQPEDNPN
ncbi:LPS assembly protein LptD, partial [Pseudomonas aeruginosa]